MLAPVWPRGVLVRSRRRLSRAMVLVGGRVELATRARCRLPNAHTHTMVAEVHEGSHDILGLLRLTPRDADWRMLPLCCHMVAG